MFSFHKPKIYRSNLGCCICKAKSSSSRFTDSKKYENEFERCFRIQEKRSGEICNACVLLVKRWKKLSAENRLVKHWHHVVDARAGPGTKLTSGRRLTSSSSQQLSSSPSNKSSKQTSMQAADFSDCSSSSNSSSQSSSSLGLAGASSSSSSSSHPLPLGSSQATNKVAEAAGKFSSPPAPGGQSQQQQQQPAVRRRGGSFSNNNTNNKGRSTDIGSSPNFGETNRRNYMTPEGFSASASSSLPKPQSALNSSAFESVIKRFRQRQQQQLLQAQRRQLKQRQRLTHAQPLRKTSSAQAGNQSGLNRQLPIQEQQGPSKQQQQQQHQQQRPAGDTTTNNDLSKRACDAEQHVQGASKRAKRNSESIGSLSVDGLRVSSLLDSSIWRKEKVCCGIIFRGLYNEVAIFPKLLKPCQCRMQKRPASKDNNATQQQQQDQILTRQMLTTSSPSPPPRAQKSGSISSCDSNTSGTGSMEEPILDDELLVSNAKETATATSAPHLKFIYI